MRYIKVEKEAFFVGGLNFYGDPFTEKHGWDSENAIGQTWQRYIEFKGKLDNCFILECHIYSKETKENGKFEVLIGEETDMKNPDTHLVFRYFPKGYYYVLTLEGEEINSDWYHKLSMMEEISDDYLIQCYDERFKGLEYIEQSILEVWVPAK